MSNTNQAIAINEAAAVVSYKTENGAEIQLTAKMVKEFLVNGNSNVSDSELFMFMQLCQYQRINPFLREAYLIKYGSSPAQIVCGKELFTKRAERHPDFDGYEAGVIVLTKDNKIQNRPGTTYMPKFGEQLLGGWSKVHRKSFKVAFESTAMFDEYKGSSPLWNSKPATMIRKVALVQALREAFPDMYGGLYSQEEINTVNENDLPKDEIVITDEPKPPQASKEQIDIIYSMADEISAGYETIGENVSSKAIIERLGKIGKPVDEFTVKEAGAAIDYLARKKLEIPKPQANAEAENQPQDYITEAQCEMLFAKADDKMVYDVIGQFGYDSAKDVLKKDFDDILAVLEEIANEDYYSGTAQDIERENAVSRASA